MSRATCRSYNPRPSDPAPKAWVRVLDRIAGAAARSYRGRPGCACGCRGRYSVQRATVARDVAQLLSLAENPGRGVTLYDGRDVMGRRYVGAEMYGTVLTVYAEGA